MRHHRSADPNTLSHLRRRRSDERFLARAARGDAAALATFYDRHGPTAYGLALRVLGEPSLAEAVVEDAFISLTRRDRGHTRAPHARTCLFALVHRKAIEALRSRPDTPRTSPPPDGESDLQPPNRAASERTLCKSALAQLPDEQRQALELSYFDGLRIDELADRLGQSREMVSETLRASLHELQAILKEQKGARGTRATGTMQVLRAEHKRRSERTQPAFRERESHLALGDGNNDGGRQT